MANNAARAATGHQQASSTSPTSANESSQELTKNSKHGNNNRPNINSSNSHLLSPDSALHQSRRKSTLSANGFFIDHSCTRRRSLAAAHAREQQLLLANNQAPAFLHPTRWQARLSVAPSTSHRPSSVGLLSGHGRQARHSTSGGASSPRNTRASFLVPAIGSAPTALVGSRKTSIFDPTGHSIGLARSSLANRRRSTMVTGASLLANAGSNLKGTSGVVVEPSTSRMMNVATAAARSGQANKLTKHVPVLGCSPTSIRASLAALEETRRYEKLLRRLQRQQRRKSKRKQRELARAQRPPGTGQAEVGSRPGERRETSLAGNLRRRSILALRDAATLIRRRASTSDRARSKSVCTSVRRPASRWTRHTSGTDTGDEPDASDGDADVDANHYDQPSEDDMDRLSMSSLSFITCSSRSSVPSLVPDRKRPVESSRQNNKADAQVASIWPDKSPQSSVVRRAMRRLTGHSASSPGEHPSDKHAILHAAKSQPSSPRSPSACGRQAELGFWYHYYYYLRENSVLDDCLDLPISSSSVGQAGAVNNCGGLCGANASRVTLNAQERRARLHINYSLNRLEILNSRSVPTIDLADIAGAQVSADQCEQDKPGGELSALDYDQSTDVSLSLSTSSQSCSDSSLQEMADETLQGTSSQARRVDENNAAAHSPQELEAPPSSTNKSSESWTWHGSMHLQAPTSASLTSGVATHQESGLLRNLNSGGPSSFCSPDSYAVDSPLGSPATNTCRAGDRSPASYLGSVACVLPVSRQPEFFYSTCPAGSTHDVAGQQPVGGGNASLHNMDIGLDRVQSRTGGQYAHSEHASGYLTPLASQDCRSLARRSQVTSGSSHNNLTTPDSADQVDTGSMGRRSASFSTGWRGISSDQLPDSTAGQDQDNEEELDDFERFNRSHRGYKPLGGSGTSVAAGPQKQSISTNKTAATSCQSKRDASRTIRPHAGLRSSFKSALKFCRGQQGGYAGKLQQTPDNSWNVPGLRSGTRISMSWDMLARPADDSSIGQSPSKQASRVSRLSFRDPARDIAKRFELVYERPASSASNTTLANHFNDTSPPVCRQAHSCLMIEPLQVGSSSRPQSPTWQQWPSAVGGNYGALGEPAMTVRGAQSHNCVAELDNGNQLYNQQYSVARQLNQRLEFGLPLKSEPIWTGLATSNQSRAARRCTSASFHESNGRRYWSSQRERAIAASTLQHQNKIGPGK